MSINRYALINNDEITLQECDALGLIPKNKSNDGTQFLVFVPFDGALNLTVQAELPPYVIEEIEDIENIPEDMARIIIEYIATAKGASDGWYFPED